jgi:hypothetical protein
MRKYLNFFIVFLSLNFFFSTHALAADCTDVSGTISAGDDYGLFNYAGSSITTLTNSGTISAGNDYGLRNSGTISASGNNIGIYNSSTITTLNNSQVNITNHLVKIKKLITAVFY